MISYPSWRTFLCWKWPVIKSLGEGSKEHYEIKFARVGYIFLLGYKGDDHTIKELGVKLRCINEQKDWKVYTKIQGSFEFVACLDPNYVVSVLMYVEEKNEARSTWMKKKMKFVMFNRTLNLVKRAGSTHWESITSSWERGVCKTGRRDYHKNGSEFKSMQMFTSWCYEVATCLRKLGSHKKSIRHKGWCKPNEAVRTPAGIAVKEKTFQNRPAKCLLPEGHASGSSDI